MRFAGFAGSQGGRTLAIHRGSYEGFNGAEQVELKREFDDLGSVGRKRG